MSKKNTSKTLSLALGAAFATSMAASNVATAAETGANPFAIHELSSGYMQLADNAEGKCGGSKQTKEGMSMGSESMPGMEQANEGKSGAKKPEKEVKGGEGQCGGNKK